MVSMSGERVEKEGEVGGTLKESYLAVRMKGQLTGGGREIIRAHLQCTTYSKSNKKQSPVECSMYRV